MESKQISNKLILSIKSNIAPTTLNDLINKVPKDLRKINIYKISLALGLDIIETKILLESKGYAINYNNITELCYVYFIENNYGRKIYTEENLYLLLQRFS